MVKIFKIILIIIKLDYRLGLKLVDYFIGLGIIIFKVENIKILVKLIKLKGIGWSFFVDICVSKIYLEKVILVVILVIIFGW